MDDSMDASYVNSDYEINTDQEDYNYDNSDHESFNDDDNCYDAADSHAIDINVKAYTILKEEDVKKRQDNDINEISNLLQVSKEEACLLLNAYNWSVSKVHEEWFADEEKVRNAVGIIVDTPKAYSPANKRLECGICFDYFTCEHLESAGCGHIYCNTCWDSYISTSVNDGPGCLSLRCPEPKCPVAIGRDMIDRLTRNEEDKKRYHGFLHRSYVESNRKMKWCPAPGCEFAVEFVIGSESRDVICSCLHGFCWDCAEDAHRPVGCETVGKWVSKNVSEAENTTWILANCKNCPKCNRAIEKNQGCMHMKCRPPCEYEFCWLCLGDWSKHGVATGGFYACNGYSAAKEAGAYIESERRREMAKQSLERYTHYYERWASNNMSRQKALEDLKKMQTVHLEKLSEEQHKPVTELVFVLEAWKQIVECRRVLKWTYAHGYYLSDNTSKKKVQLFEYLQGEAETGLERLHSNAEKELMKFIYPNHYEKPSESFNDFRQKLVTLTRVTGNYFDNLVRSLENNLNDL